MRFQISCIAAWFPFIANCTVARTTSCFHVRFSLSASQIFSISSFSKLVRLSFFFGRPDGLPLTPFFQRFSTGGTEPCPFLGLLMVSPLASTLGLKTQQ